MDLQDFIQEVLDNEFYGELKKRVIVPTTNGFNFACPFCGDSVTDQSKKRGNIYLNSKSYKCFNDGCMVWMPLKKFVATFSQKHSIEILDLDIDYEAVANTYDLKHARIEDNNIMKFLTDTGALGTMLDMDYVRDRFSLISMRELSSESAVRKYLEKRLLFNVPDVTDYIYADNTDSLIYIFNYHKPTGKILSLATRKIEYKKYKVIPYSHICEALHIKRAEDHYVAIDQLGEYFNILNIDMKKPIKMTEGQIDSMFLQNAGATQGVTKSMFLLDYIPNENIWTMFDRDKGGVGASIKEINAGRRAFMWSLMLSRLKKKYSSEVSRLLKIKDTNDLYVFLYERTGLPLDRFNTLIDSYFTSSKFDMLYL